MKSEEEFEGASGRLVERYGGFGSEEKRVRPNSKSGITANAATGLGIVIHSRGVKKLNTAQGTIAN